jgi:hypothetical protein
MSTEPQRGTTCKNYKTNPNSRFTARAVLQISTDFPGKSISPLQLPSGKRRNEPNFSNPVTAFARQISTDFAGKLHSLQPQGKLRNEPNFQILSPPSLDGFRQIFQRQPVAAARKTTKRTQFPDPATALARQISTDFDKIARANGPAHNL